MKLQIKRSQKKAGMIQKNVVFVLHARTQYTEAESFAIREYGLSKEVIYNSETAKDAPPSGVFKRLFRFLFKPPLVITIQNLSAGLRIRCKSLEEIVDTEATMHTACENLKAYLRVAESFDGREEAFEF